MNIEEKKADFIRRFKASRERKAEYNQKKKNLSFFVAVMHP